MSGTSFFSLPDRTRWIVGFFTILLTLRALLYHLDLGQANLVVMAIVVGGLRLLASDRPLPAGLALGLAPTLKTIVLPLWIPFVIQARARVLAGIAAGLLAGLLAPALFVGFDRNVSYVSYWITDIVLSADDLRNTPHWPLSFNYSLAAQWYRFFGDVVSFEHDGVYYNLTIVKLPDAVLRVASKLMPVLTAAVIAVYAWIHRARPPFVSLWGSVALAFCLAPAFSLLSHKHYFVMLLPAHFYVVYIWHVLGLRDRWFRGLVVASFVIAIVSTTLFDYLGALLSNLGGLIWGAGLLAAAIFRAAGVSQETRERETSVNELRIPLADPRNAARRRGRGSGGGSSRRSGSASRRGDAFRTSPAATRRGSPPSSVSRVRRRSAGPASGRRG